MSLAPQIHLWFAGLPTPKELSQVLVVLLPGEFESKWKETQSALLQLLSRL